MNNVINFANFKKNKPKYILFLFMQDMPLTITPRQSLWYVNKNKYYELYNGRWLFHPELSVSFSVYEKEASDIIEAFELNLIKNVVEYEIFNEANRAVFDNNYVFSES